MTGIVLAVTLKVMAMCAVAIESNNLGRQMAGRLGALRAHAEQHIKERQYSPPPHLKITNDELVDHLGIETLDELPTELRSDARAVSCERTCSARSFACSCKRLAEFIELGANDELEDDTERLRSRIATLAARYATMNNDARNVAYAEFKCSRRHGASEVEQITTLVMAHIERDRKRDQAKFANSYQEVAA